MKDTSATEQPRLTRRFGLLPATALNMTNMIGVGPFITIPLLMSALGGPQALLGWIVALIIVVCDGMVWSELGAAMPGSGGSFHYLREAFGREKFGRLMGFLFVWQFVLSGPLEIASGYIGFGDYASYIWKGMTRTEQVALITGVGLINIALLYRRIHSIATLTVALWIGTLITVVAVIVAGAMHFDAHIAFDFPPGAFNFSIGFFLGLGAASRIGIYDYLGYYNICYIGDEVRDPGRVIPRSILISTAAVAVIYLGINLSLIGVVPWREFVPAASHPESSFIVSIFMQKLYGSKVATAFTLLVLWTAFGSVFALLLGYSRIPYAAAESGYFFRAFGRLHPTKGFPYVSLLVLGAISIVAGLFSLGTVIDALIVTRILVQFMGQIVGLILLRRNAPDMPRPYRMWLYPIPGIVALFGWIFVFATTQPRVILFGVGVLALGGLAFLAWSLNTRRWPFALVATSIAALFIVGGSPLGAQERRMLRDGWWLQSSGKVGTDGARLSLGTSANSDWYKATVPSTVVGTLVEDSVFKDPFFGMNLRSLPGMTYKIGGLFVHATMDTASPFAIPWWYRTSFRVPASMRGKHVSLQFDGINYRANIWLNGKRLADSSQVAGSYRRFEFDITEQLAKSGVNALAVEIWAPTPPDLQPTWVDWNPAPPDKTMGLWQPVWLAASGDVQVRHAQVVTHVDTVLLSSADLDISATLRNVSAKAVSGALRGHIGNIAFSQKVTIGAGDTAMVRFAADSFPQLHFKKPRLWWPTELAEFGKPELYELRLEFVAPGVTDAQRVRFGIREITSEMTPKGATLFRVNGKRILVRGGGWANDMFFRPQPARQDAQLLYARDMHLNTIRLEGNYEDDRFFQRTDSLGLLVMTGWVCCDAFEEWSKWKAEQHAIAAASLRDQIRRIRSHPSVLVWLNGSDGPPPPDVEQMYLRIEREERWPNPTLSSASARAARFSGKSGVKMTGPYDWVPPSYWLQDVKNGGGWGFNTETSPGAAVPPIESMRRMLPAQNLTWPTDSVWNYHSASGLFTKLLDRFNAALSARFGAPSSVEDYTATAQLMTYEGERAMFEAYRRNKYESTGVIQWMLNNAWPSIYWHLFDWYLRPGGGYFGAKKANEPVHVLYSYDDRTVAVVNGRRTAITGVHVRARVLGVDGTVLSTRDTMLDLPADSSVRLFAVADPPGVNGAYFADLRLTTADNTPLSTNFYWLTTRPDVLADTSTYYMRPVTAFADLTALRGMPPGTVKVSAQLTKSSAAVTLKNPGKTLAFFVRLQVVGSDGEEALPVLWDDNYVTLLPGETRVIKARWNAHDIRGVPRVAAKPWNAAR